MSNISKNEIEKNLNTYLPTPEVERTNEKKKERKKEYN